MMINILKKAAPLLLALIINGAGHAYFVITIPVIGREMALSDVNVGLILTISALMLIITGPIWGWLCDKIGRKKVLVIGLLCSGIASVAIGMLIGQAELLTASFFSVYLLTIRLVQALLSSGLKPATQAVIVDLTEHSTRISGMGIMGATFGMGAVTGGLIAMLSGHKYIVTGYVAIGILMLISSLWVALQLPETRPQVSQKQQQWFLSPFIICFSTTLLGIAIYSALQPVTSWKLQDTFLLDLDQAIRFKGAIMMSSMIAMILAQLSFLKWQTKAKKMRFWGLLITAIALLVCTFVTQPYYLLITMIFIGIGFGLFLPSNLALMTISAKQSQQGKIAGVNTMCQGIGMTFGPIGGAALYHLQPDMPYYFAVASITLLVLAILNVKE